MKYKCLFELWMMTFNRTGLQSMRSSDHWVNGVNEHILMGMVSLAKEGLQSKIIKHGTIFKLA